MEKDFKEYFGDFITKVKEESLKCTNKSDINNLIKKIEQFRLMMNGAYGTAKPLCMSFPEEYNQLLEVKKEVISKANLFKN